MFVFVSMLAFSAQDLILEPFAGSVFGLTPGATTQLSGLQHGGVLLGMIAAALAGSRWHIGSLRQWTIGGCIASALALAGLVAGGAMGPPWPLHATVFALGAANGAFSIAAIGSMMRMASQGRTQREGVRMGLWGAAQAIAFADDVREAGGTPILVPALEIDSGTVLTEGPAIVPRFMQVIRVSPMTFRSVDVGVGSDEVGVLRGDLEHALEIRAALLELLDTQGRSVVRCVGARGRRRADRRGRRPRR